jgi:hypothetical protein
LHPYRDPTMHGCYVIQLDELVKGILGQEPLPVQPPWRNSLIWPPLRPPEFHTLPIPASILIEVGQEVRIPAIPHPVTPERSLK